MIIKDYQLNKVFSDNKKFLCFLFYGPNEGLVREQIDKVAQKYTSENEYDKLNLQGKELDEDATIVDSTLNTVSMFFRGKLLILESLKEKHLPIIEKIVNDEPQDSILIVKSDSLTKASKLRNFFETQKSCYAIACYEDDAKSLMKQVDNFINKNNLKVDRDIKSYLVQNLSNDRMIINNELEKISLYVAGRDVNLSLNEVKHLLNDSSSQNLNRMSQTVMNGNTSKSSKIVNKLLSEGVNPISLLRSLISYFLRIQATKIEMKKGKNFDVSIKVLKPPVFWKDKDSFQNHCLKWPLKNIEKSLDQLLQTEISCKLNSNLAIFNCEKSILIIAKNGQEFFQN